MTILDAQETESLASSDLGIRRFIGKTITHVVLKESDRSPNGQVFLVLSDGTYMECDSSAAIRLARDLRAGGLLAARNYLADITRITYEIWVGS